MAKVSTILALIFACAVSGHGKRGNETHDVRTVVSNSLVEKAPSSRSSRIINGQPASRGQFPYMAAIFVNGDSFCGGSLISDRWVLTAAHCTVGGSIFTVYLGATRLDVSESGRLVITTRHWVVHSSYSPNTFNNDISLINLGDRINFTEYIKPICLASGSSVQAGSTARVPGWGRTSEGGGNSNQLNYVDLFFITNAVCQSVYGSSIPASMLCIQGSSGRRPCTGDSGGPVVDVSSGCQVGVVSALPVPGCTPGYPVGSTRVSSYISWIATNTGISQRPVDGCVCFF